MKLFRADSFQVIFPRWLSGKGEGWILGLLFIVKLGLVAELDIVAGFSPHDQQWMINKAAVWYWGDPSYTQMTYIKEPLMPLFLALCRAVGVPARLGLELLLGFAAWILCRSIPVSRPTVWTQGLRILLFSAVVFFPPTVFLLCTTMADPLFCCLLVFWLALAVRLLMPGQPQPISVKNMGWLALTSVGLGIARPEVQFVMGALIVFGVCWLASAWPEPAFGQTLRTRALSLGLILVLFVSGVTLVKVINYCKAGFWGISEQTEPNFRRALAALRSVPSQTPSRYVWIDNATLKRVAAVSPAVAQVEPYLTGPLMVWTHNAPPFNRPEVEAIAPGWFCWALRDAVFMAGQADTPQTAAGFYQQMANEIEQAQKRDLLPRQSVLGFYLGSQPGFKIKAAVRSFGQFWAQGFRPQFRCASGQPIEDAPDIDAQTLREFDEMGGRRIYSATALPSRVPLSIKGWFMETQTGHRLKEVWLVTSNRFGAYDRPDVGLAYGWSGSNQQWGFGLSCPSVSRPSEIVFVDDVGQEYPVSGKALGDMKPGRGVQLMSRDGTEKATCWIDSIPASGDRWARYYQATQARNQKIWRGVERAWPWLIGFMALAAGFVAVRAGRGTRRKMLALAVLGLGIIGLRYAMLTVVDVWLFSAHDLRYTCPVDLWILPLLILLVWVGQEEGRGQRPEPQDSGRINA